MEIFVNQGSKVFSMRMFTEEENGKVRNKRTHEKETVVEMYDLMGEGREKNRWLELAKKILELVGGEKCCIEVRHCATRLRIVVADKEKIQVKRLKNLEKEMKSFLIPDSTKIILGTGLVNRIYDEVVKVTGTGDEEKSEEKKRSSMEINSKPIRMFSDVFVPIIPVP